MTGPLQLLNISRSIFYPSASVSYILSDSPGFDSKGNYYKLRASYGTSANFPSDI